MNNGTGGGNMDIAGVIKNEYSSKQSWDELKQAFEQSRWQIPLFTKCLLLTRFVLYWVSWFTATPNNLIVNDPALTFDEGQLWRLFLCPLFTSSFFFDILFIMPLYLCFFCYVKEYRSGTLVAYLYFNLLSVTLQLTSYAMCLGAAASVSQTPANEFLSKDSAFFSVFTCEVVQAMLQNPNKPVDLLFCKVAQKYFILVALALVHWVLPYAWIDIAAVILIALLLHVVRNRHFLIPVIAVLENATRCSTLCASSTLGYITAERGVKNAMESSDDLVAFNRREIKGNVSTNPAYIKLLKEARETGLTTPSSSSTTAAFSTSQSSTQDAQGSRLPFQSSANALGGTTSSRSESKLLQMRRPVSETPEKSKVSDRSMDEDELLEDEE